MSGTNGKKQTYEDRFGNVWSVRLESEAGNPRRVLFTCKSFRLIAEQDEQDDRAVLSSARLKELFCDAERVLEYDGQEWRVGFRDRTGRGGKTLGGTHTRFRSENGEVRYAKTMVHFRHMPQAALRKHLVAATPSTSAAGRAN